MDLIVYYEGANSIEKWVETLLGQKCNFKKLPAKNNSAAFAQLPSYVADILYLDKPDIIISGRPDSVHERPIFSIELATCTPQYQHSIQRFSRSLASVSNGCPSVLIMPMKKRANDGKNLYMRSAAADYGAVRLNDIYGVPAIVVDWPEVEGELSFEGSDQLPSLKDPAIEGLATYLKQAIKAFEQIDYLAALRRLGSTQALLDRTRERAYAAGSPRIGRPGGGLADGKGQVKLDVIRTEDLIKRLVAEGRADATSISQIPEYFRNREECLVFYPTRVTAHSGDPYVGMMTYYDIAFCRTGPTTRDRRYNLVALCNGVGIDEITDKMKVFNNTQCPFNIPMTSSSVLTYSYHLKDGCRKTKSKPTRIYGEMSDLIAFTDGILVSP